MRVPVLRGVPSLAYSSPPISMMCFTWQSDSTLLTIVGHMVEAEGGGEIRRLDARVGALALERLDQAGFLAADVGAGAAVDVDVAGRSRCRGCSCRGSSRSRASAMAASRIRGLGEFLADVDVGELHADREAGDHHALEQLVRVLVEDVAVLEGAGLGFVGVAIR
jgi:hypothetical protein